MASFMPFSLSHKISRHQRILIVSGLETANMKLKELHYINMIYMGGNTKLDVVGKIVLIRSLLTLQLHTVLWI